VTRRVGRVDPFRRSLAALGLGLALGLLAVPATVPAAAGVTAIAESPVTVGPRSAAAIEVEWGRASAVATFGESITFEQPATLAAAPARVEFLLEFPGGSGPLVIDIPPPGSGATTLRHVVRLAEGHLLPNTRLVGRWRLTGADGTSTIGPETSMTYDDTRFAWRTEAGSVIRVHWYEGDDGFGRRALEIGERAIAEAEALLGVSEAEPIDFFVYARESEFYDALGPGTRENVGGQANAEIRTLFALISPAEINQPWVESVVPHELVHLVFDSAVANPYHFPPRWLNEGLAVYLADGYPGSDRSAVERAARDGTLMPLDALTGQFPTSFKRFSLAYSESVAAVDWLVAEYGPETLVELIRSYADGVTDDEAFLAALGLDAAGVDAAWRASLDAAEPVRHGPQPAPLGPIPADWQGPPVDGGSGAGPTPTPAGPAAPRPDGDGDGDGSSALPIVLAGLAAVGLLGAAWLIARTRRRPPEGWSG
jgi:hypothetical protein